MPILRSLALVALITTTSTAAETPKPLEAQKPDTTFLSLFDGKTLDGW
jgi:hypothetical protein